MRELSGSSRIPRERRVTAGAEVIGECPKVQWRRARVPLPHCYQQRGGQSTGTAHHPTSSLLPRGAVTPQEWREAPFCPHHSHQATRRESSCPGQASGWALSLQWVGVREVEKPHQLQEGPECSTSGSPSHSLPLTCCPGSPSHWTRLAAAAMPITPEVTQHLGSGCRPPGE